jgi:hypothetical protein
MAQLDLHSYHAGLVDKFMASEESGDKSRRKAERDLDYYDGKQWTEKEVKELKRRGQPAISFNLIRQKIDFLQGVERNQRTVPNALPRTPDHEEDAHAVKDALRFVSDENRYPELRSRVWKDILTAGWGGIEVVAEESARSLMGSTAMTGPEYDVTYRRCSWDRMFWDPYSAEEDFSDAAYLGLVLWMDRAEAVRRYGEKAGQVFDETVSATMVGGTFDDKPYAAWVNHAQRQRVRVVQMYHIGEDGEWDFCEFTKGGILQAGPSPWLNEDGEREHPYSWRSAYADRDNNRYGAIRDLIDPQDEVNKRRSKALHYATVRQTFGNKQALGEMSEREMRAQMARPDGHVPLQGATQFGKDWGIIPTNDQASQQFDLLQQAQQIFEVMGPNAAMQGKKEGNESGRAIMAQQQGGAIQMGTLTETLREMDLEVYRKTWRRIRQFWTGQTWVRVTDEEKNLKFVALNEPQMEPVMQPVIDPMSGQQGMQPIMDPQTGQPAMQPVVDPATGQPILKNAVSELDVDIEIDDAPDMGTLQQEEFANMVELARIGVTFPPKVYLAASNLRNKGDLIRMMEEEGKQPNPAQQAAVQLELQGKDLDNKKTEAETAKIISELGGAIPGQPDSGLQQFDAAARAAGMQADAAKDALDIKSKELDILRKSVGLEQQLMQPLQIA